MDFYHSLLCERYPGDAVEVLAKLHQAELSRNKYVYAIAQGGMPYTHTHHCCIGNIELFAKAMQLRWMGGLVIGEGQSLTVLH